MQKRTLPCPNNHYLVEHICLMNNSFQQLLGYPLLADYLDNNQLAECLFNAPFVLLSHNTAAEPLFNYANAKGLELFELSWQELICLPSRLSAESVNQAERDRLLAQVSRQGFIHDYQGVRISKNGKRFQIRNAIVWNLTDSNGIYQGQAACFSEWSFL
jgi:PAS domain-containing protein